MAKYIEDLQETLIKFNIVDPDYNASPDAYQTAILIRMLTRKYRDHIDIKLAEKY